MQETGLGSRSGHWGFRGQVDRFPFVKQLDFLHTQQCGHQQAKERLYAEALREERRKKVVEAHCTYFSIFVSTTLYASACKMVWVQADFTENKAAGWDSVENSLTFYSNFFNHI